MSLVERIEGAAFVAVFALGLSACSPSSDRGEEWPSETPTPEIVETTAAERDAMEKAQAENARQQEIDAVQQSDPALNWVNIGITTGKFSESLGSSVHRTYAECIDHSWMEDNECFPIAALPESYWEAEKRRAREASNG